MNPDIFAEWMRSQNHKVIKTTSSYWVESSPRVYQAFPYHRLISPSEEEIEKLIQKQNAVALRYSTPLKAHVGSLSYHVVYERRQYTQRDVSKKARHDVKKGLSVATVQPISLERLATEGWELRRETLHRQGRIGAETESWWRRLCLSAKDLPGFEAWGSIAQGILTAAILTFTCDGYFSILYQQSRTEYLSYGVNNALAYAVTAEVLTRLEPLHIFYGLQSLDAPPSVDQFKFRMGYSAKPVRQRVVFHPYFQSFVNPLSHSLLRTGCKLLPGNPTLAKAEGMFRFYLQGKLPLLNQSIPEPLREVVFS